MISSTDEAVTNAALSALEAPASFFSIAANLIIFLEGVGGHLFFTGSLDRMYTFFRYCAYLPIAGVALDVW